MSNFISCSRSLRHMHIGNVPATRGPTVFFGDTVIHQQRRPEDAVGTFTLTLQNLVAGSRWDIEVVSAPGVAVASGLAAAAAVAISLSVYSAGSASNNLRIKVRNASAPPYYQAFETQVTAFSGALPVYINQVRDDV